MEQYNWVGTVPKLTYAKLKKACYPSITGHNLVSIGGMPSGHHT